MYPARAPIHIQVGCPGVVMIKFKSEAAISILPVVSADFFHSARYKRADTIPPKNEDSNQNAIMITLIYVGIVAMYSNITFLSI